MQSITILRRRQHSKASEEYVDVRFVYESGLVWELAIPIVYRRTGLELVSDEEIRAYVESIYEEVSPANWAAWKTEQNKYWAGTRADVTKPIFDVLASDFGWWPYTKMGSNSNPARRLQDLKEMGYTIATRTNGGEYQFMLLPIARGGETGYEYWSGSLRVKIIKVLKNYDAFEGKPGNPKQLLPDHKFPEIRWNRDTRRDCIEHLSELEIQHDFQLLTNQRNQQKREVCRGCYQTGNRGYPFGIPFFYEGGPDWPSGVARTGKEAEAGCHGCGWYDLERWRLSVKSAVGAV